jgi:hypothetical protein
MKSARIVVGRAASGHAAMPGGANRQIFASPMAAQTKSRKEFRNGRVREDEGADRRGAALWRSAFMFFVETFAAYAASMHPTTAFSVEAALIATKRLYPWPASRTPIAGEHERGSHLISRRGNVVELERAAAFPATRSPELVELATRKHPEKPDAISVRLASQRERQA